MPSIWTNINIYNCEFYADYAGNSAGGTASIYVSQGPSVNIYNNTFRSDSHSRSIGIGHSNPQTNTQVVRIYNNSFFNSATPILLAGETNIAFREVYIENNIFWRDGQANHVMINHDSGVPPKVLNRNIYFSALYSSTVKFVYYNGAHKKFADLRAMGFEVNGLFTDPGFVYTSASLASVNDLRLRPEGGAVGRGSNLSAFFTIDKEGKSRAATGAWDVGAYISGATRPVESPVNLRRE